MKKNYPFALLLFLSCIVNAQINFSDPLLKAQLLSANNYSIAMSENGAYIAIDTNADGEISIEEALQIKALFLGGVNIASLSGLEYFSNLRRL